MSSTAANITVQTGFDGSCPRDAAGVREADGCIRLFPGYRRQPGIDEEAVGQGSRLEARLLNRAGEPQRASIIVDWQTSDRVRHHDVGYVRHASESDWRMVIGRRSGTCIHYDLLLPPGVTELSLAPTYNVARCDRFVAALADAPDIDVAVAGHSEEGRSIWRLHLPSTNPDACPLLLQARDHAYETAGSYAVEGIVAHLRSNDTLTRYLRERFDITILPMTNPDGVHNGMSRLTHERGAHLEHVHAPPDAAHATLRREIDRVRPLAHMNLHNWMFKFMDGILASDDVLIERIIQHMPADHAHHKRWFTLSNAGWLRREQLDAHPEELKSWRQYVPEQFGGYAAVFEFPWFGLSEDQMRRKGARAFTAFALSVIELLDAR